MKDKDIINLVEGLYKSIYVVDCYGSKDMLLFATMIDALNKRGYEMEENSQLQITKIK